LNPHFKKRGIFILISLIVAAAILLLFSFYFINGLKPVNSDTNFVLKVEKGQGLREIAATLSQAHIIRSITVFKLYAVFSGKAQNLKAGVYELNSRLSTPEIINLLIKGSNPEINVIINEGATLKEIDKILASANIISAGDLLNFDFKNSETVKNYSYLTAIDSLEGFLYPDTYRFKTNSSVEEVAKKFFDNFQDKIWSLINQKDNWYEILILASILDKEVPGFEDQQLVAGIINKRIKTGMPIQTDATIAYAKCDGDIRSCSQRQVTKNDLKVDSPYNTYTRMGLPPTPIANMSQASIRAALNPKNSNYWYYLSASKTKETIFSKTLEEHNINRQKYLNI
jgi:UPF0755 protein